MSEDNHEDDDSNNSGNSSVTETDEEKATREAAEAAEKGKPKDKGQNKSEQDDLAPIKANLDKAYEERDNLAKELAALKKVQRDKEIEQLTEEGKHKEAFDMQIKERDETILSLQTEIVGLTRDISVRDQFRSYEFKNEKASALAYDSVVKELIQDDKGKWVHKSGRSISEFVKSFSEDEDNNFLFKAKTNSGNGSPTKTKTDVAAGGGEGQSYSERPQSDMIKDIRAGKVKPKTTA